MHDAKIVELYWERNESAIEETQKKYHKYLFKIADNILSDKEDSLESVNDTYFAAWRSIPPHRPNVLSTYLGKLTRRISIDIFRKRNREKRIGSEYAISLTELDECIGYSDEMFDVESLADIINSFLKELKPEERSIFICRYYYADSIRDIAKYCGISESKVKTTLYRTRIDLRKYLKKEGCSI